MPYLGGLSTGRRVTRKRREGAKNGQKKTPPATGTGGVIREPDGRSTLYTEKLSPQPQVREALGLMNWKPLPLRPSEKSSSVPNR